MDKYSLSERDICTKFITPAVRRAGWDVMSQIREEVSFTKGRIIVRGKLVSRGKAKRADYVLYYKPNIPLALIEAKDNSYGVGDGMQQGLDYATTLHIPFVFSSNGDGFVFHDRTGSGGATETNLSLNEFPPPAELWGRYRTWKGLTDEAEQIVLQDYFDDGSGKEPRYYEGDAGGGARPMNADRLLQHYEKTADAPDAIPRLRRFVLDLAVRGKLVPQDANDEPASELLKRIAAEKARLVKAGEIRKSPELKPISDVEALYALPRTWAWVRVGDIFDYDAGTKRDPKELSQERWLLELEDIEKDTSRIVERLRVSDRDSQSTKSEFEIGDILYGKLRPYLNKVVVADESGYSTTEIVAIRPFLKLCPEYCALAFRRPDFVAYVERLGRGTKMPRLRTPDAIVAPFPLPPSPSSVASLPRSMS
jgi:hypothetical protein